MESTSGVGSMPRKSFSFNASTPFFSVLAVIASPFNRSEMSVDSSESEIVLDSSCLVLNARRWVRCERDGLTTFLNLCATCKRLAEYGAQHIVPVGRDNDNISASSFKHGFIVDRGLSDEFCNFCYVYSEYCIAIVVLWCNLQFAMFNVQKYSKWLTRLCCCCPLLSPVPLLVACKRKLASLLASGTVGMIGKLTDWFPAFSNFDWVYKRQFNASLHESIIITTTYHTDILVYGKLNLCQTIFITM